MNTAEHLEDVEVKRPALRYLEDGRLNIDNNRAERAIKPFVIGRKIGCLAKPITMLMRVLHYTVLSKPPKLMA